jgi:transposase
MDIVYERCCGLDVHKKTVVACLVTPGGADGADGARGGGGPKKKIRSFGTMTDDLLALADWLHAAGCTHVAMEATGVYWKPLYNLLEGDFELLLVNPQHVKQVPGRKTDAKDCEWLADLLRHGLLRGSFVPDRPQRELRELTRYRTTLVRERSAEVNRLQKTLEGANVKLAAVASNVVGASGRAMLAALVAGETDTEAMAQLAKGRLREKRRELERALVGRVDAHQRFLLAQQLAHVEFLNAQIDRITKEIATRLEPVEHALEVLQTIPGVGERTAQILVAELGTDMERFPTARHLASWAGVCPGNNESAGKRKSGRTRRGSPWLRAALLEAAHAASHTRNTYLAAQYRRLAARRGKKRAAVAVAHTILLIAHHLLRLLNRAGELGSYRELGGDFFDRRDRQGLQRRLTRRLERLGYTVTVEATAPV